MKPTTHKTKVSEAGRGTYLIWQRVKHAGWGFAPSAPGGRAACRSS